MSQAQMEETPVWNKWPFMPEYLVSNKLRLCLLYTSDAADERSSVDLGGRRIIKKKNNTH